MGESPEQEADVDKGMCKHADALCRIREGKWPPIMTIGVMYSINTYDLSSIPNVPAW